MERIRGEIRRHFRAHFQSRDSFILCLLRKFLSLLQSEFSTECDLVLPLSISSKLSFSLRLSSSCLRLFPSLPITYILPTIFPTIMCFRSRILCKMSPIQLDFLLFYYVVGVWLHICRQTSTTHTISTFQPLYVISVKYRLSFPDDGSYVIRNMLR